MATSIDDSKATVRKQREIEREVLKTEEQHKEPPKEKMAAQAGACPYPEPPFPAQHIHKPGRESDLDPRPMYDAPYYRGSGKLQDMVAIVTGGDSGIGRAVAVLFAREGADVVIIHLDESDDALETRKAIEQQGRRCLTIAGDVGNRDFCFDACAVLITSSGLALCARQNVNP